jgi:methyltransferase (TIGR00027 family)
MSDKKYGRSLIAGINALFRQVETDRANGAILEDKFARFFAEKGAVVNSLRILRFAIPALNRIVGGLQTVHNVRHCAIDNCILKAYERGCRQFVVLGAGYDMRPFRLQKISDDPSCLWLELDNPATAQRKLKLLKNIPNLATRSQVIRIQTRFEHCSLCQEIESAGIDNTKTVCFILEGLIHYQSRQDFLQLCSDMLTGVANRDLIMSFITPSMERRAGTWQRRLFAWLREIPVTFFTPEELEALFQGFKCNQFEHWDFQRQIEYFAPQAKARPVGVSQDIAHITRN